jgi:hypothetical protein
MPGRSSELPSTAQADNESHSQRLLGATVAWICRFALVSLTALCLLTDGIAWADDPIVNLTIRDHRFEPSELTVPAHVKVKLIVRNADSTPEEFESIELRREKVVPGGQEIIVYVGPLQPGTYEFFGDFHPQSARGHLIVK